MSGRSLDTRRHAAAKCSPLWLSSTTSRAPARRRTPRSTPSPSVLRPSRARTTLARVWRLLMRKAIPVCGLVSLVLVLFSLGLHSQAKPAQAVDEGGAPIYKVDP